MVKKKSIKNPEISDTGKNWNVVTGCDKFSDGCLNCYAEDVAEWLPTHFFKIVYDSVSQDAIVFLASHRNISKSELPAVFVSVDEVERRTGLDFNRLLNDVIVDDIENDVEAML